MSFRKFSQGCGECRKRKIKVCRSVDNVFFDPHYLYHNSVIFKNPGVLSVSNQPDFAQDIEIRMHSSSAMRPKQSSDMRRLALTQLRPHLEGRPNRLSTSH